MNEETILVPEETTDPTGEPTAPPTEIPFIPLDDGLVIETEDMGTEVDATYVEDLFGSEYQETIEVTSEPVTIEIIEDSTLTLAHINLFGSFLICGTIVGCTLLRKIYGT